MAKHPINPALATAFRWSFITGILAFASILTFGIAPKEVGFTVANSFLILVMMVSAIIWVLSLGIIAHKLQRRWVVWIGLSFLFSPLGPVIAYGLMLRHIKEASAEFNDASSKLSELQQNPRLHTKVQTSLSSSIPHTTRGAAPTLEEIPAHIAEMTAEAFRETAFDLGYLVKTPDNDRKYIAAFPIVPPNKLATSMCYANFRNNSLTFVTKGFGKDSVTEKERIDFMAEEFASSIFNLLDQCGPQKQEDGSYRWSPPETETVAEQSKGVPIVASEVVAGFLEDLEIGEPYTREEIVSFTKKRYPNRSAEMEDEIVRLMDDHVARGLLIKFNEDGGRITYVHKDHATDYPFSDL